MPVGDRFNKRMQMGYLLTLFIALTSHRKAYLSIENKIGKYCIHLASTFKFSLQRFQNSLHAKKNRKGKFSFSLTIYNSNKRYCACV